MSQQPLEETIERFIAHMRGKYGILGVMLSGSYVTGKMRPHSDIDVFFLWRSEAESMRGRMFFEGREFEYFLSPEWKYYDRLEKDLAAQQIYAMGRVTWDPEGLFGKIKQAAERKVREYAPRLCAAERASLSFHVETILKDGMDLLGSGQMDDFRYLTGRHIPRFCDMAAKARGKYPIYQKNAMERLRLIDPDLTERLQALYGASGTRQTLGAWEALCRHVLALLGDVDISDYRALTPIAKKEKA